MIAFLIQRKENIEMNIRRLVVTWLMVLAVLLIPSRYGAFAEPLSQSALLTLEVNTWDEMDAALQNPDVGTILVKDEISIPSGTQAIVDKALIIDAPDGVNFHFLSLEIPEGASLELGENGSLTTNSQVDFEHGIFAVSQVWVRGGSLDASQGTLMNAPNIFVNSGSIELGANEASLTGGALDEDALLRFLNDERFPQVFVQDTFSLTQDAAVARYLRIQDGAALTVAGCQLAILPDARVEVFADSALYNQGTILNDGFLQIQQGAAYSGNSPVGSGEVDGAVEETGLPLPQVTLDESTVTRGDFLAVRIANMSDYEPYLRDHGFKITATPCYEPDGEWYETYEWNELGTIWVPTQSLNPAGREEGFTLYVNVFTSAYPEKHTTVPFTVTQPEQGTLNFSVSNPAAITGDNYLLSVYAPGASEIAIHDPYKTIWTTYGEEGSTSYGYKFRGSYTYYATATYYDDETGEASTLYSDEITVEVTAPYGDVQCSGVETDASIPYGEGITLRLGDTSRYQSWDLNVKRVGDGQGVWHSWGDPASVITVPAQMPASSGSGNFAWLMPEGEDVLAAGEHYEISLCLFARGYHGYAFNCHVLVTEEGAAPSNVTTLVNGCADALTLPVHDTAHIQVQGPMDATALRIFSGTDWKYVLGNEADYAWVVNSYSPLNWYLFHAQYTLDPVTADDVNQSGFDWNNLSWSQTGNVVRVDCLRLGELPAPQVQLDKASYTQGEWITATIINLDDYAAWEGIRFYAAPYYDPWGQGYGHLYDWNGVNVLRVPTANLNPDNKSEPFSLHVTATLGLTGWKEGDTKVDFTVTRENAPALRFDVYPCTLITGDTVTFSVYAPGAAELSVWEDDHWIIQRSGANDLVQSRTSREPGQFSYRAAVKYPGDTEWTFSDPIAVTAQAPFGEQAVSMTVPSVLDHGNALTVSVTGLAEDASMDLRVIREADGFVTWHAWGSADTWTVPVTEPLSLWNRESRHTPGEAVLEPDTRYRVEISVDRPGYISANLTGFVENVTQRMITNIEDEYLSAIGTQIFIMAPGAERIDLWWNGDPAVETNSAPFFQAEGDTLDVFNSFGYQAETVYVKIKVTYPAAPPYTEVRQVTVTAPEGDLWGPRIYMNAGAPWTEGQDLSFYVAPQTAVFVQTAIRDHWTGETVYADENARFFEEQSWNYDLPAHLFTPGRLYDITVLTAQIGYNYNKTLFPIVMLPANPATLTLPSGLSVIEADAFSGVNAQVMIIPDTVKTIEAGAFANCPNLIYVRLPEDCSGVSLDAFSGCGPIIAYGPADSSQEMYCFQSEDVNLFCLP